MQDDQNQPSNTSPASMCSEAEVPTAVKVDRREAERRQHLRYPFSASLEAVELQSKARFSGRISDLSMGGCYVDTITVLNVGANLKIRLTHDNKIFESRATVMSSSAGMGMGLLFTETGSEQLETLDVWIRELSGELLPCEAELPEIKSQQLAGTGSNIAQLVGLNELIIELMGTGVLSELKGKAILHKISRR
jgi:PilZ domain